MFIDLGWETGKWFGPQAQERPCPHVSHDDFYALDMSPEELCCSILNSYATTRFRSSLGPGEPAGARTP